MSEHRNMKMSSNGNEEKYLLKRAISGLRYLNIQELNSEVKNLEISIGEIGVEELKDKIEPEQKIEDDIHARKIIEFLEREDKIRKEEKMIQRKERHLEKKDSLLEAAFINDDIFVKKINLAKAMTTQM